MVVSFHPLFPGDRFFWERGRITREVVEALSRARAVILPPTVSRELYYFCRRLCPNVFPNYDARFRGEGKVGDTLLFWAMGVPHPRTVVCPRVVSLVGDHPAMGSTPWRPTFPCVIKGAHGGEGTQTWLVEDEQGLERVLALLKRMEMEGRCGFVVQEYIPGAVRDLRVVKVGRWMDAYWRINPGFHKNLSRGGRVDRETDPHLMEQGRAAVEGFCRRAAIDMAAFDLIFRPGEDTPLFLEINWHFGTKGIGGERFASVFLGEVERWLSRCACPP